MNTCMIFYYLIFKRDLKLLIKKAALFKKTILSQIIELIYKVQYLEKV